MKNHKWELKINGLTKIGGGGGEEDRGSSLNLGNLS